MTNTRLQKTLGIAAAVALVLVIGYAWQRGVLGMRRDSSGIGSVVALYSNVDALCGFTELSEPYAHFVFYYVQDGSYAIASTTDTDCADKTSSPGAIIGERIVFDDSGRGSTVRRENGRAYSIDTLVSTSPLDRNYFRHASLKTDMERKERPYIGELYERLEIRRSAEAAEQCQLLRTQEDHDTCLAFLAGTDLSTEWCRAIKDSEFREQCIQWVGDLMTKASSGR